MSDTRYTYSATDTILYFPELDFVSFDNRLEFFKFRAMSQRVRVDYNGQGPDTTPGPNSDGSYTSEDGSIWYADNGTTGSMTYEIEYIGFDGSKSWGRATGFWPDYYYSFDYGDGLISYGDELKVGGDAASKPTGNIRISTYFEHEFKTLYTVTGDNTEPLEFVFSIRYPGDPLDFDPEVPFRTIRAPGYFDDGVNHRFGLDEWVASAEAGRVSASLGDEQIRLASAGAAQNFQVGEENVLFSGTLGREAAATLLSSSTGVFDALPDRGLTATKKIQRDLSAEYTDVNFDNLSLTTPFDALTKAMGQGAIYLRSQLLDYDQARLNALEASIESGSATEIPPQQQGINIRNAVEQSVRDEARAIQIGVRGAVSDGYADGIPEPELAAAEAMVNQFINSRVLVGTVSSTGLVEIDMVWLTELGGSLRVSGHTAHVVGSYEDDRIKVATGTHAVAALGEGDDRFYGGNKGDVVTGHFGQDRLTGKKGDDSLFGGTGDDRLTGGRGADLVSGGDGDDFLRGDKGSDLLTGGNGADKIIGGARRDKVFGGDGPDVLFGNAGHDTLSGDAGNDHIRGGAGRDRLIAGQGDDHLFGGAGGDVFVFESPLDREDTDRDDLAEYNVIYDFDIRRDVLDYSGNLMVEGIGALKLTNVGEDLVISTDLKSDDFDIPGVTVVLVGLAGTSRSELDIWV